MICSRDTRPRSAQAAVSPEYGGWSKLEQAAGPRVPGAATARRPARPRPRPRPARGPASPPLHRPLTSYYLILGITTLLLALGLVMVLSTSSVAQLAEGASPYSGFQHQLVGCCWACPACGWRPAPGPGCSAPPPTR